MKTAIDSGPYTEDKSRSRITMIDLFAGAGGLTHGFHEASARYETIRAVELDVAAAATYTANYGDKVYCGSVSDWPHEETVPEVDVVVGGPPCQGFSLLGKRRVDDERNFLWQEYATVLTKAMPKYFVLENVPAFGKSRQLADLRESTSTDGALRDFDFEWAVLNSADYGAPQARKRAIILGWRRDMPQPAIPLPTHTGRHQTVRKAFTHIPTEIQGIELPSRYVEFGGKSMPGAFATSELHLGRSYEELSMKQFASIPPGGNRMDLPDELLAPCWRGHTSGSGDVMGRLHWDKPSVTIRTEFFKPEKGRYIHPVANRALTHLEAATLQGFPRDFKWVGSKTSIARQIGNAVPLWLGKAVATSLVSHL
jgi:DNA (cytosine-5)-methyltransferase 1